ncbi:hypothetical protein PFDG_00137 [Plasmodium falciparum Dd2]|uniref:Erythrocyte membrane protein 1 n=4 Tax=Plasmodium falciparum TaxID=5833 RepID=A0A0L7LW28_PLAF4|nr:hypothetical protein PFDG_00137 [Plasmodium falciparum Dd2]
MVKQNGGGGGRGGRGAGSSGEEDKDAKNMFDRIGAEVQKEAHSEALERSHNELQGHLSQATYANDIVVEGETLEACKLDHIYHTNVTDGHNDPCGNRPDVRFSDKYGGQCTDSKIKGNNKGPGGACAPFRRLFLCDQNLEYIKAEKITSTHNLLLEVSLAAKHEGKSLSEYRKEHSDVNSKSGLCTILARSFADIGDIVRGRDLYLGNKKYNETEREKEKLQTNLKNIFAKIYGDLSESAKKHYGDDENYYQLREDWWTANRQQIWNAIICDVPDDAKYLEESDGSQSGSHQTKCRCYSGNVLTNFDYVPQFLRWFDEWTEEFCRKKKKYVDIVKTYCRDESKKKYCSLNGHDCTQTIRKIGLLRMGNECTKCLLACSHYRGWLANQEKEFAKQKEKYTNKIIGRNPQKKGTFETTNNDYDRKFYEKLKTYYGNVDKFLELLNEEKECKAITTVEGKINFPINNYKETFYRSEYCELCPECGVIYKDGEFKERGTHEEECRIQKTRTKNESKNTDIDFLFNDEHGKDILEKLKPFCGDKGSSSDSGIEKWKCSHYEVTDNECIMQNNDKEQKNHSKIMTFVDFFEFWVTHMLKDSIDWRKYIKRCINNSTLNKCKKGCNTHCQCFQKWIKKKQEEWNQIKAHYKNETDIKLGDPYDILEYILEEDFFEDIKKAYGNEEAVDRIKKLKKDHASKRDEDVATAKYAIDILLEHELEEAEECLEIHPEDEKCTDEDDDDDHHEEPPIFRLNPCGDKSGRKYPVLATKVAHQMHDQARQQLTSRAGGRKALRADASEGTYKKNGKPSDLKGDNICNINTTHSNATGESKNPCHGKDNEKKRFVVGTKWETGGTVQMTETEAYMPPRRQHMCTSNLENLDVGRVTENGKASHSLLGDVLLAANKQAERIKNDFFSKKYDNAAACRAMKYSFADIGDIIRGTDLWDKNKDATGLQDNLKKIFSHIHKSLKKTLNGKGNDKYNGDDEKKPQYKQLREDWWEANRRQVWKAMRCAIKEGKIHNCDGIPIEDYIPQRLRWMTEWAEWYCKAQKKQYDTLDTACKACRSKGEDCTKVDSDCTPCKKACDNYKKVVDEWEKQWNEISYKYLILYEQAQRSSDGTVFLDAGPDYQLMVDFFKELQKTIRSSSSKRSKRSIGGTNTDPIFTSPYSTAAGYIHQEVPHMECQVQKQFCKKRNGETPPTGTQEDDDYTFREKPKDHDGKCSCDKPPKKDACDIVDGILAGKKGNQQVGDCHPKIKDKNDKYPDWQCGDKSLVKDEGVCMPPRRQKLCVHFLANDNEIKQLHSQVNLREAFIKSAAAETFLSWNYYKNKNGNVASKLDEKLKKGTIPPEFLRSMFYTYGDYRDFLFGTDISKGHGKGSNLENKINSLFPENSDGKTPGNLTREDWWKTNGPDIWKGMLCALTNASGAKKETLTDKYKYESVTFGDNSGPNLQTFSSRPQFLRWFTEWAQDFCYHQAEEIKKLEEECNFNTCEEANVRQKSECQHQCNKYKKFLRKWKAQYKRQNIKYEGLTDSINIIKNKEAPKFLTEYCKEECSCFQSTNVNNVINMFEKLPDEYIKKCPCPNVPETSSTKIDDIGSSKQNSFAIQHSKDKKLNKCALDENICKNYEDHKCNPKKNLDVLDEWNNLYLEDFQSKNKGVLIPPRRRQLCFTHMIKGPPRIQNIDQFKNELLKGAVMEGKRLGEYYKNNSEKAIEAMTYSFADYADIIKGNDMIDTIPFKDIKRKLEQVLEQEEKSNNVLNTAEQWWKKNRKHLWNAMLCGYKKTGYMPDAYVHLCIVPDTDETPQFLRWMIEWAKTFCNDKRNRGTSILKHCKDEIANNKNATNSSYKYECEKAAVNYVQWARKINEKWTGLSEKFKRSTSYLPDAYKSYSPERYLTSKCGTCDCKYKDLQEIIDAYKEKTITDNFIDTIIDQAKNDNEQTPWSWLYPLSWPMWKIEAGIPKWTMKGDITIDWPDIKWPKIDWEKPASKVRDSVHRISDIIFYIINNTHIIPTKDYKAHSDSSVTNQEIKVYKNLEERNLTPQLYERPEIIVPTIGAVAASIIGILLYKRKPKHRPSNLFSVIDIPQNDYDMPTTKSSNSYVPYESGRYSGKTYIYMEGDETDDYNYVRDIYSSDITSSSESEYEEMDINDIYVPGTPKYKTLIEVVLEPSGKLSGNTIPTSGKNTTASDTQNDIQNDGIPSSKITDNEWNTLKDDFISQYLQSEQPNDVPNDYSSGDIPFNTQPNTLYFDNNQEKPFIMSIHDRNLYSGEEYNYNVNMVNSMDDIPINRDNNVYSGIDLINDTLSGNKNIDIYDEVLKRKENELFGTNHVKQTSIHSVAKPARDDPLINQLDLFHTWLDRHRNMCEKWNKKEELLDKLKEEWENETHSGNTHPSDSNKTLNTDVSIQIHMDNPKSINEFTNMDTILEDLEKYNEPYYDVQDDIYYDVHDHDASTVDSNNMDVPSKVQIEMDVNTKLVKEKYPIADVWHI